MPPKPIPGLRPIQFKLDPADRKALAEIDRARVLRTNAPSNKTQAIRWAIRELSARLHLERLAALGPCPTPASHGPATEPPE